MNKIIKVVMHVPVEQYGYIEVEMEGTVEEIINQYLEIKEVYKNLVPPF